MLAVDKPEVLLMAGEPVMEEESGVEPALLEPTPEAPDSDPLEANFRRLVRYLRQIQPRELAKQLMVLAFELKDDAPDGSWVGLKRAPAGRRMHHNREGGLVQHILQMIEFALMIYHDNPQPFKGVVRPSDLIIACFLHDLHKARACFREDPAGRAKGTPFEYLPDVGKQLPNDVMTLWLVNQAGIKLTQDQINAVILAEGGYSLYRHQERSKLAVLVSMADEYSALVLRK
ncbi:MAG: hypothetical protein HY335_00175 [Deinococcus sp.]|nr:hypothetical protein [Deinococcus sp.]